MAEPTSNDVIRGTDQALKTLPSFVTNKMLKTVSTAIREYPVDCPAQRVLEDALEQATPESMTRFIMAAMTAKKMGVSIDLHILHLLRDKDNNGVFYPICQKLKSEYPPDVPVTEPSEKARRYVDGINRRSALKIGAFWAFTLAAAGEVVAGGWTDPEGPASINITKAARVALELVGAIGAFKASNKEGGLMIVRDIIADITPEVEKSIGIKKHTAALGNQSPGGNQAAL